MSAPAAGRPHVVIVGAGCAGLAAGIALQKRGYSTVILERADRVGGLAGGIELDGNVYEYGPHIFHTTDPEVLGDVKDICKDVLEPFERTIKIKFGGKYFDYPLSPFDVLTKLPPLTVVHACASLAWHVGRRRIATLFGRAKPFVNSEEALRSVYGEVLYRIFFRDYIRKVWGVGPDRFSPSFANQRLPRFGLATVAQKLWRKIVPAPPQEIRTDGYVENVEGEYFTTRRGFSLICEAFAREYERQGGRVLLRASLKRVLVEGARCVAVEYEHEGRHERAECGELVSTIPLPLLPPMISPPASPDLLEAAGALRFRAIVFVGLLVSRPVVLPASFMYFRDKTFNRLTDLARFKVEVDPPGSTILIAEITCDPGEALWSDTKLAGDRVVAELVTDGILAQSDVKGVHVFRSEHGYPVYGVGYEERLATALAGLGRYDNIHSIGRQGRFAYVNTHVAMKMGYDLARAFERRHGGAHTNA
jgi:protoporphyrinogen oxidase